MCIRAHSIQNKEKKEIVADERYRMEPKPLVHILSVLSPVALMFQPSKWPDVLFAVAFAPALICQIRLDFRSYGALHILC